MKAKTMSEKKNITSVCFTHVIIYYVALSPSKRGLSTLWLCVWVREPKAVHHENTHQFSRFEYRTRIWGSKTQTDGRANEKCDRMIITRLAYGRDVVVMWASFGNQASEQPQFVTIWMVLEKKTVRFHCVLRTALLFLLLLHSNSIWFDGDLSLMRRSLRNSMYFSCLIINRSRKTSQHLQTLLTVSECIEWKPREWI